MMSFRSNYQFPSPLKKFIRGEIACTVYGVRQKYDYVLPVKSLVDKDRRMILRIPC